MGMMQEFKEFASKGSVIDLAVGVIIGGAFGKIVDSLVQDVIMPVVGKLFGGLNFADYYIPLNNQGTTATLADAKKLGAVIAYGNFLTISLNFLILAFVIFQMVRVINKARKSALRVLPVVEAPIAPPPPPTPEDITLLREIRDVLKERRA